MNTVNLTFNVSGQTITAQQPCPYLLASNTVNYVKVHFNLGNDWTGFNTVKAVWVGISECISTLLDNNGDCFVPQEMLAKKQKVFVNMVGTNADEDVVLERLTTYPQYVLNVEVTAYTDGSETVPLTPSQFDQYIAIVEQIVGSVKDIDRTVLNPDYTLTIYYTDGTSDTVGPIRGATGATGNGILSAVLNSDYTLTLNYTDGNHDTVGPIRGAQGETGNGIQSIYLTGTSGAVKTYTILFTNGDTTEFQVTDGEVTNAVLEQVLPTDNASGSIASFPDGTNLFTAKSLTVDINPVQDLHGYDKPWVGGAGANKWDEQWEVGGIRTADGTTVASESVRSKNFCGVFPNTVYYAKSTSSYNAIYVFYYDANKDYIGYESKYNTTFTTPANAEYFKIQISSSYGTTYNHDIAINYPSSVTTYSPYSNICPITGWTGCEVVVSPTQDAQDGTTYSVSWQTEAGTVYGGTVDLVTGVLTVDRVSVDLGALTWNTPNANGRCSAQVVGIKPITSSTDLSTLQAEWYTTITAREWYDSTKIGIAITGAGYGGNDKVGVCDTRLIGKTDAETKTMLTGCKIVYPLAQEQTYQLDPVQVACLLGQNNVWANCGDTSVTYKADVQRWVIKMLGQ